MNNKKIVAIGLIVSMSLAFVVAILEPSNEENWYLLCGAGLYAFGIWASNILLKK